MSQHLKRISREPSWKKKESDLKEGWTVTAEKESKWPKKGENNCYTYNPYVLRPFLRKLNSLNTRALTMLDNKRRKKILSFFLLIDVEQKRIIWIDLADFFTEKEVKRNQNKRYLRFGKMENVQGSHAHCTQLSHFVITIRSMGTYTVAP